MFELFLIFCISLFITMVASRIGAMIPVTVAGIFAGGLLWFAYSGVVAPGAFAGLLAAGSNRLLWSTLL